MSQPREDLPEPDRREGAPHPRETPRLFGQEAAEAEFLAAAASGRRHHAWLIAGPEGIGKATLAWRIARHLIATPATEAGLFGDAPAPASLDVAPDHPVARRIAALSEPGLFLLRRPWDPDRKRLRQDITVEAARGLQRFFGLSAAEGGHRVVIVDAADELNTNAANALLKLIEEPPARATLLMVCHRPSALLPTIRSRCRLLRCAPLSPDALTRALAQAGADLPEGSEQMARLEHLSAGSPGIAWDLLMQDGLELDRAVGMLFASLPGHDRRAALKLADRLGTAAKAPERRLFYRLLSQEIAAIARAGIVTPTDPLDPASWRRTLAPGPGAARHWAEIHQSLGARLAHAEAVNLDPHSVILDMVRRIDEVAARAGRP
ncbi:MAG: DNA polymerase III subunit delta' [Pseudomonadota bacterium]